MKKTRKAISAPLGVIFGVLLAIILVVLATFIAFNISTTAVKSQGSQPVVVGTPVIFYDTSDNVVKVAFTIKNPSASSISITDIIVGGVSAATTTGVSIEVNGSSSSLPVQLDPKGAASIVVDFSGATSPPTVGTNDKNEGYMEIVIATSTGTIKVAGSLVEISG